MLGNWFPGTRTMLPARHEFFARRLRTEISKPPGVELDLVNGLNLLCINGTGDANGENQSMNMTVSRTMKISQP